MLSLKKENGIFTWLAMTVACILYSMSIALFLNPNGLAPGGVSGIAIIIHHLTGFPTGLMIVLINIPLLIIGCFAIGKWFLIKTVYAIGLSSVLIDLWPKILPSSLVPLTDDKLLAGIGGAVLLAVGVGVLFRCGGSTGGTDIITKLLRRRFRSLKTGVIFLILDSIIVTLSAIAFRNVETALYAAISLFISSRILDVVLYGTDGAKLLIIISRNHEVIAKRLMEEADVGVTYAQGLGAYTGEEKKIIICAVKKHLFPTVKDLVKHEDPTSFMIVSGASEVFGEGYKPHDAEEL